MNSKEYKDKNDRMEALLHLLTQKGKLSKTQHAELDKLSDEISDHDEIHYPFKADTLQEMIELRMFQRKLKQKDVAELLGTSPSRISEILNGKRELTFELAKQLYQKLNIDPTLILSD